MWNLGGGAAARVAAADGHVFPDAVAERFRTEHREIHPEDVTFVEGAARQWFRLLARRPRGALAQPSRAVADWWLSFVHEEAAYRVFCQDAFGAFVPHRPPPAGPGEGVADGAGLQRTLKEAGQDEPDAPHGLPWLFRVDAKVGILNARRYIATCGGGGECHVIAGCVCLKHLGSDRLDRRTFDPRRDKPASRREGGRAAITYRNPHP